MEEFDLEEVQYCASMLSGAEDPSEAVRAWAMLQGKHPDLRGMVSFTSYKKRATPPAINKYTKAPMNYLMPYFMTEHIYFLDDELLVDMFNSNKVEFGIDYTLMFDSNIATYINRLVRGESLGSVQTKVVSLVDEILHDNLNFDHIFYMTENVKNVIGLLEYNSLSKLSFWRSLNKNFRNNMVSLQLFRSIDCEQYKRTSNPVPVFSYSNAARRAIDFCYDFYASKIGREHILDFVLVQRIILLQLIGMITIQLSSNRSSKNKMSEYFEYVHNVVGAYFDRESVIAHKYFMNRQNVTMLKDIHKGDSKIRLLKRLDNIAWDMASPRFMEKMIAHGSDGGKGRYFIPMFLSFDSKLRDLLGLFPVKGAIYNKETGELIPLPKVNTMDYFTENGCKNQMEYLYSDSARNERKLRDRPSRKSIHEKIKCEYRKLRTVIS